MTAWVAFIESNTSGTGRLFAQAAKQQGFRPILLAEDPARYPYAREDGLEVVQVQTQDEASLLAECCRLARSPALAGVTSSSEYFIEIAATLAQQLGLPGAQPEAVRACRNKLQQRIRLRSAGVGVPDFHKAESGASAVAAAEAVGFPVVVKTVSGSGSVGVKLCRDAGEVAAHATKLLQERYNERGMPVPGYILVEELATGSEYSVETFNSTIVGITQKHLGAAPFFVEAGHDYPAALTPSVAEAIQETALHALAALGLGWGPAHVELRAGDGGVKIIEVNPRLAGGFIPEIVRLSSGVDLIKETMSLVVGSAPNLSAGRREHASIRFIIPATEGTLSSVEGVDEARKIPGVEEVKLYYQQHARVRLQGDFRDRAGHVVARGDSAEAARGAAVAAHQCIRLVVAPGE